MSTTVSFEQFYPDTNNYNTMRWNLYNADDFYLAVLKTGTYNKLVIVIGENKIGNTAFPNHVSYVPFMDPTAMWSIARKEAHRDDIQHITNYTELIKTMRMLTSGE